MSISEKFVTLEELSTATGRTPSWFMRHHRRLSRDEGMPEKSSLGWVWPRKRMEEWIDGTYGRALDEDAAPAARVPTMIANQNQRLRARYARAEG
ncbi:hypothetical protein [Rhizobium sp. CAU 1783]